MGSNSGSSGINSAGKSTASFLQSQDSDNKTEKATLAKKTNKLGQQVIPTMAQGQPPSVLLVGAGLSDGEMVPRLTKVTSEELGTSSSKSDQATKKADELGKEFVERSNQQSSAEAEKARKAREITEFLHAKVLQSKTTHKNHLAHNTQLNSAQELSEVDKSLFLNEEELDIEKKFKNHTVTARLAVTSQSHLNVAHGGSEIEERGLVQDFELEDGGTMQACAFGPGGMTKGSVNPTSFQRGLESSAQRNRLMNVYVAYTEGQIVIRSGRIDSKERADDFLALIREEVAKNHPPGVPLRIVSQQLNSFEHERTIIDEQHRWIAYVNKQLKSGDIEKGHSPVDAEVVHINIPSNRWYHLTRALGTGLFGAIIKALIPKKIFGIENAFQGERLSRDQNLDSWGSYSGWVAQDLFKDLTHQGISKKNELYGEFSAKLAALKQANEEKKKFEAYLEKIGVIAKGSPQAMQLFRLALNGVEPTDDPEIQNMINDPKMQKMIFSLRVMPEPLSFLLSLNYRIRIHINGIVRGEQERCQEAFDKVKDTFFEKVYPLMSEEEREKLLPEEVNAQGKAYVQAAKERGDPLIRYGNLSVSDCFNMHQVFGSLASNQQEIQKKKQKLDPLLEEIGRIQDELKARNLKSDGKKNLKKQLREKKQELAKKRAELKGLLIQDFESFDRIEKVLLENFDPKDTYCQAALQKASLMKQVLGSQLGFKSHRLERGKEGMAIQLLNEKLGIVSALNCKSGLDRTGLWHAVKLAMLKVPEDEKYILVDEWETMTDQMNQVSARLEKLKESPINEWLNRPLADWKAKKLLPKKMTENEFEALKKKMSVVIQFRKRVLNNLIKIGIPITTASTGVMGFKWNSGYQENLVPLNFLPTHVYKKKENGTREVVPLIKYQSGTIQGMSRLARTFLTMFQKLRGS